VKLIFANILRNIDCHAKLTAAFNSANYGDSKNVYVYVSTSLHLDFVKNGIFIRSRQKSEIQKVIFFIFTRILTNDHLLESLRSAEFSAVISFSIALLVST
jgi:hypothetical protein